jgi:hypothetical protein
MSYISRYREPHESFPQPDDGSIKVWRYLDLAKLIGVLHCNQLPFVRMDLLGDEFEGSVPKSVYDAYAANPLNAATMARLRPQLKRSAYVTCWHANNAESEAMWRLYCGDGEGVALQTTYERLDASLQEKGVFLGRVTYVDYEHGGFDQINSLTPLMHKRPAFEHEREVRGVIWRPAKLIADGLRPEDFPPGEPPVMTIRWNVADVVDNVFVSPYAKEWYRDVVATVIERFAPALVGRLCWSGMKAAPLF